MAQEPGFLYSPWTFGVQEPTYEKAKRKRRCQSEQVPLEASQVSSTNSIAAPENFIVDHGFLMYPRFQGTHTHGTAEYCPARLPGFSRHHRSHHHPQNPLH